MPNADRRPHSLLVAAALFAAVPALAVDGVLDTGFSTDGIWYGAQTLFLEDWNVQDAATAPDWRPVVAGRRDDDQNTQHEAWFWQGFHSSGSAGVCVLEAPNEGVATAMLAFDSQGRLLLAGVYDDSQDGETLMVARYLYPDCTLDESFGGGLGYRFPHGEPSLVLHDLVLDGNDRMFLVGNRGSGDAVVVALTAAGALDSNFAGDGVLEEPLDELQSSTAGFHRALILPGGDLVAAGNAGTATANGTEVVLARYSPTGAPVTSFSGDGYLSLYYSPADPDGIDLGRGLAWDPRLARLYVAGSVSVGGVARAAVAAVTASGSLDTGFSTDGRAVIGGNGTDFRQAALDGLGRLVVAGTSGLGSDAAFYAARLLASGALDGTFGTSGVTSIDVDVVASGLDLGNALALLPGGIAVAGNVERSASTVVGIVRLTQSLLFADGFEAGDQSTW